MVGRGVRRGHADPDKERGGGQDDQATHPPEVSTPPCLILYPPPAGADVKNTFASDNAAPLCPEALAAIEEANHGTASSYGADPWTARASAAIRDLFETDCAVFFVSTGTVANALGLAAFCRSHHAVICHEAAHLETDECGAPEFFTGGARLLTVGGAHGKLDPQTVEDAFRAREGDVHFSKPAAVSLTESSELGTVYTADEVGAIAETARGHGLRVHLDGARFANAVAAQGVSPRAFTVDAGVDVLSFGGSKNGIALGEAIVFFDRTLALDFEYRQKQAGQLTSKTRFLSAPWGPLLADGTWLRNARRANAAASRVAAGIAGLPGVRLLHPVEANAVFVDLLPELHRSLAAEWAFHSFIGNGYRFMGSWQSTDAEVDALVDHARRATAATAAP
jgi:threonine aldolase